MHVIVKPYKILVWEYPNSLLVVMKCMQLIKANMYMHTRCQKVQTYAHTSSQYSYIEVIISINWSK